MDNTPTLLDMNSRGEYSLRQAIRQYLGTDNTRKLIEKWEPTGVFFEKFQLSWRDCFFLAALTAKYHLLGTTAPPCSMSTFAFGIFSEEPDVAFTQSDELKKDHNTFVRAMATMQENGIGHCIFATY